VQADPSGSTTGGFGRCLTISPTCCSDRTSHKDVSMSPAAPAPTSVGPPPDAAPSSITDADTLRDKESGQITGRAAGRANGHTRSTAARRGAAGYREDASSGGSR
jgi:hypothetical protein